MNEDLGKVMDVNSQIELACENLRTELALTTDKRTTNLLTQVQKNEAKLEALLSETQAQNTSMTKEKEEKETFQN